jgi:ubiquitin carboxyl-terminal hydrolase 34
VLNRLLFGCDSQLTEASLAKMTGPEDLAVFERAASYKCHHKKSREAAYKLFLFLVNRYLSPEEFDKVVRLYWTNLVMRMEKPAQSYYDPSKRNRAANGFAGLKNLGSTCYMNSMLQQFFNVPTFRYSLLAANDGEGPSPVEFEGRKIDDNWLHQWQRLFASLQLTDRQDYNTRDFCHAYKDGGQPVNVRVQQDASEFLNVAFDRLENMLKKSQGEKYLCQNVFQGETAGLMACTECGHLKQRDETFYLLAVQVKDKKDIHESL